MVSVLLTILAILGLISSFMLAKYVIKNKDKFEENSWFKLGIIGFVTNFLML